MASHRLPLRWGTSRSQAIAIKTPCHWSWMDEEVQIGVFPDCPRQNRAEQVGTPDAKRLKTALSTLSVSYFIDGTWLRCYSNNRAMSKAKILYCDPGSIILVL